MVTQALIAAGGFGTRMPNGLNPKQNKAQIIYAGQTMLGHLIDGLLGGGIKRFILSAGYHNLEEIRNIAKEKQINSIVVPYQDKYRKIPYIWQDLLKDQFLFACGHHPINSDLCQRMVSASQKYSCVITTYNNAVYPINKKNRIIFRGRISDPQFEEMRGKMTDLPNHWYIRNPFVVSKKVINLAKKFRFKYTFSYYIYRYWLDGGSVGVIKSNMPPEFDYDYEFEWTKKYLDRLSGTHF